MKKISYPNEKKINNKLVAILHFLQAGVLYLQSLQLLGLFCLVLLAVSHFLMDGSEGSSQTPAVHANAQKNEIHCSKNREAHRHQMDMAEQILISCPWETTCSGKLGVRKCWNQRLIFQKSVQHQTLHTTA